ncbi:XRE family transcriptional regulator [Phytohabitans flavus]|uniref:Transcriptional regulator n=1 Tax=Phytohabitans flavus TaxID=1076124 RepID=A0A6F8Y013_9ACTN|nr:XRE family transcriptional regulator [Phytohabitans flavus]BCB79415.1 transcriptional regulator [Phytohabitans flavus]
MTETVAALTAAVAGHVRALRTARGWSLDELAGRSGVSKGMVVQIEAARTNPSVGTLVRIADAFGVTIARLLEPAEERTVRISDAESAPQLWRGSEGGFGRLLRGMNDPSFVELWEWRFAAGERHTSENHMPGTREVLHVLEGTLTLTVDGVDYTAAAGQTIDFLADRAHTYTNATAEDTRLMMIAIIPNTEWDRRSP